MKNVYRKYTIPLMLFLPIVLVLVIAAPVFAYTYSTLTTVGIGDPNGNDFWGASTVQVSEIIDQIMINQMGWESGWDLNTQWNEFVTVNDRWVCGIVGEGLYLCAPMPPEAKLCATAYYYFNGSWLWDDSDGGSIPHPFAQ